MFAIFIIAVLIRLGVPSTETKRVKDKSYSESMIDHMPTTFFMDVAGVKIANKINIIRFAIWFDRKFLRREKPIDRFLAMR